jgi:lysophospholipase L1-like esterase
VIEPLINNLPDIQLLVVFFGSNDAMAPGDAQYVDVDRYADNLRHVAEIALVKGVKRVILVGPSLYDEENAPTDTTRSNAKFRLYTKASERVAHDLDIGHLDLGEAFLQWIEKTGRPAKDLLPDTLHYSGEAYKIFYDALVKAIDTKYPEISSHNLNCNLPGRADIDMSDIPGTMFGKK